jgi:galactonate dehydratase
MPELKHCGGLLDHTLFAALADADGVAVAPQIPSGPVSTAATVQVCAGLRNFRLLELQWGEVPWRRDVLQPADEFVNGSIAVPSRPGFGVELNDRVVRAHLV